MNVGEPTGEPKNEVLDFEKVGTIRASIERAADGTRSLNSHLIDEIEEDSKQKPKYYVRFGPRTTNEGKDGRVIVLKKSAFPKAGEESLFVAITPEGSVGFRMKEGSNNESLRRRIDQCIQDIRDIDEGGFTTNKGVSLIELGVPISGSGGESVRYNECNPLTSTDLVRSIAYSQQSKTK